MVIDSNKYKVLGAKAGKEPAKPVIAKDSVASLSLAKILYGLGEGEISGIVGGAKGIFLEGTPLEDESGNSNFDGVTWDFRSGTLEQEYIKGFPDVSNELPVSVELKSSTAWIKAINKPELSAVRIRLSWNGLKIQNLDSGDINGYRIDYAIDVKTDSGAYVEVLKTFINDKVSGKYERTHRLDLPKASSGWQIRVRRLTANANKENIQDKMFIESITEVIDVKLRYPNTALLGLQYDAKTFSRIAKIAVRAKGKLISIPTNYNTTSGTYVGLWNGTFKQAYSNNPAWVFYDIVTNPRYGLGKRIDKSMLDKWSIYQLGVYCDELIDDGEGGKEKRYSCNVYLQSQQDAFKVLQQLSGIFKGITFWNGEQIVLDSDTPQDAVYTFSRANVIDGNFEYSGTRARDRHTVAKVAFDNPNEGFKTEYEYIRDEAGIAKFGINIVDISALGCTSRGQAQRAGLWALKSEQLETRTVAFKTGLEGFIPQVGNIIEVSDELLAGRANGGRIAKIQGKAITLDRLLTVAIDDELIINSNNGKSEKRKVINVAGKVITVATAFTDIAEGAVFAIRAKDLNTMRFRVMSIKPDSDNQFSISAMQHEPLKFDAIDYGADVKPTNITVLKPTTVSAPSNVSISAIYRVVQGQSVATMVIQWSQVKDAVAYVVEWRKDNGNWIKLPTTGNVSAEVEGVYSGNYLARVTALNAFDVSSTTTTSTLTEIKGKVGKPKSLASIKADGLLFGMAISWKFLAGSEDTAYTEIQVATDALGTNTALLGMFSYPTNKTEVTGLQGGLTVFYRGRIVDKLGNVGDWSTWAKGTTDNSADKLLTQLEGQITEQQLFKDLGTKIDKIGTNSTLLTGIDKEVKEAKLALSIAEGKLTTAEGKLVLNNNAIVDANKLIKANKDKLVLTDSEVAQAKTKVTALEQDYNGNKATVSNALTVLTNKDKSLASDVSTLSASYKGSEAKLVQDLKVLTDKDTSLTNLLTTLDSDYKGNKANVTKELTALATKNTAIVKDIDSLNTKTDNANTEISTVKTLISDNKQSIAKTKTDLITEFNNLEVGGRNLVLNSEAKTLESKRSKSASLSLVGTFKDLGIKYITISSFIDVKDITLSDGTSNSFDERYNRAGIELRVKNTENVTKYFHSFHSLVNGDFKGRVSRTIDIAKEGLENYSFDNVLIQISTAEVTGVVKDIKVETGNKATDWSLAPEDTAESFIQVRSSITEESESRSTEDKAINSRITILKSDYDGNKATVSNKLTSLTDKDTSLASDIRTLDTDYKGNKTTVTNKLTALSEKDISIASDISKLNTKTDASNSEISTIKTAVSTNKDSIAETKTNLSASFDSLKTGHANKFLNASLSGIDSGNTKVFKKENNGITIQALNGDRTIFRIDNVIDSVGYWTITFKAKCATAGRPLYIDVLDQGATVVPNTPSQSWTRVNVTPELQDFSVTIKAKALGNYTFVDFTTETGYWFEIHDLVIFKDAYAASAENTAEISRVDLVASSAKNSIAQTKTELLAEFNTLEVGSRNLVLKSTESELIGTGSKYPTLSLDRTFSDLGIKYLTISCFIDVRGIKLDDGSGGFNERYNRAGIELRVIDNAGVGKFYGKFYNLSEGNFTGKIYRVIDIAKEDLGNYKFNNLLVHLSTKSVTTGLVKDIKVENGNKVTDWSPAPEDVDKAINANKASVGRLDTALSKVDTSLAQTKVDLKATTKSLNELEVGGTNLLRNSDFKSGYYAWGKADIYPNTYLGLNNYRVVNTIANTNFGMYVGSEYRQTTIAEGKTYTLSFYCKGTASSMNFIHLKAEGKPDFRLPAITPLDGGLLTPRKITFVAPWTSSEAYILIATGREPVGANFEFGGLKLERGNIATEWSPSPTDVEESLKANTAEIEAVRKVTTTQSAALATTRDTLTASIDGLKAGNPNKFVGATVSKASGIGNFSYNTKNGLDFSGGNTEPTVYRIHDVTGDSDGYWTISFKARCDLDRPLYIDIGDVGDEAEPNSNRSWSKVNITNTLKAYSVTIYGKANKWVDFTTTTGAFMRLEDIVISKDAYAAVQAESKVRADAVNGLSAQWTMKLDVNGYVSGVGQYNNGTTSQFAVRADQFYIANPSSKTADTPFQVTGGKTVIKDAYIRDASITTAKIGLLQVTQAELANGTITTAKIGTAQVDTLQIKGEAIIVPRVQFTEDDFSFRTIDTEEVINTITLDSDGGGVSISFGFEKIYAKAGGDNQGNTGKVNVRIKRGTKVLRTLSFSMNGVDKNTQGQAWADRWTLTERFITLPTILDTPPKGNQTYTVTLESRGLNSGKSSKDLADHPVVITARSFHIMGAKR